jgi:hypothetical protein
MVKCFSVFVLTRLVPLLIVIIFMMPEWASSTAQRPDKLVYQGETVPIYSNPLESFFDATHRRPNHLFPRGSTACWRRYTATWKIENEYLYLIKVEDCTSEPKEIPLSKIFPGRETPIMADWFSGTLRIPRGNILLYVHMGYGSIYERDMLLTIEKGKLIRQDIVDNTRTRLPSEEERALDELRKLGEWQDNIRKNQQ